MKKQLITVISESEPQESVHSQQINNEWRVNSCFSPISGDRNEDAWEVGYDNHQQQQNMRNGTNILPEIQNINGFPHRTERHEVSAIASNRVPGIHLNALNDVLGEEISESMEEEAPGASRASAFEKITDTDLGLIYESYLNLYIQYLLLLVAAFGILFQVIHYIMVFIYFWLLHIVEFYNKVQAFRSVPKNKQLKRFRNLFGIGEIFVLLVFEVICFS